MANKTSTHLVQFEKRAGHHGHLGIITLNRPQALNALNAEMINSMYSTLHAWADDPTLLAVIIQSNSEKAFCAGGDIRSLYDARHAPLVQVLHFFATEYRLNLYIHQFPKPYISFLNGIVMGGGAGISIHGSHRVVTEKCLFAMPETAIGFIPDIGASYFFSHVPDHLGIYLGLTGARLEQADMIFSGLGQYSIPSIQLNTLCEHLLAELPGNTQHADVTAILAHFCVKPTAAPLQALYSKIDQHFRHNTVEAIFSSLAADNDAWAARTHKLLQRMCPLSLKITLRQLRAAKGLVLAECLKMEYRIVTRLLQAHNFFEGIRAAVIEKGSTPQWQPAQLSAISEAEINSFFAKLTDSQLTELTFEN